MSDFLVRLTYVLPAILVALTFHEYAHARVAYAFGDPTAKNAGRLTINPLKHLDPVGALLLVFMGFGWAKAVPVNPYYFEGNRKRKLLLVSLAGPLTNLLEALCGTFLLFLFLQFVSGYNAVLEYIFLFLSYFVQINLVLAVFNLLPIPPLDGSKILAGLLPDRAANFIYSLERYGFVILLVIILIPRILGMLGLPEIDILGTIIGLPAQWLMDLLFNLFGI